MNQVACAPLPKRHALPFSPTVKDSTQRTSWLFYSLCIFVMGQAYAIPILTLGPSWTVWPNVGDIAILCLLVGSIFAKNSLSERSPAQRTLWTLLLFIFIGAVMSYALITISMSSMGLRASTDDQGESFGIFQLYRLGQALLVFFAVSRINFTERRTQIVNGLVNASLLVVCASVLLCYFSVIECSSLVPQVPSDPSSSGAWAQYFAPGARGWGTISYNHGCTAAVILILCALKWHLNGSRASVFNTAILLLSLAAVFASGSRAGFAAMVLFVSLLLSRRPAVAIAITLGICLLFPFALGMLSPESKAQLDEMYERQQTLLDATSEESTSGRHRIWSTKIAFLNENPTRWLVGSGFGAGLGQDGSAGHMLPLHIILETGLIGLVAWCWLAVKGILLLWNHELRSRAICIASIALLFSSLVQETFYPVPAMHHFLSLYACCLAIALRQDNRATHLSDVEASCHHSHASCGSMHFGNGCLGGHRTARHSRSYGTGPSRNRYFFSR